MTESEDNRKRNDWTNNPFERVNHSTNFEDYAISSSDEPNFYERINSSGDKNNCVQTSNITQPSNELASNPFKRINKFEPKINPIISTHLPIDSKDHLFVESCLSAGNSSADVTPSGTPQSSPYSIRKVMENNKKMVNTSDKKNLLSANPKRWFYTGFFNSDIKAGVDDKPLSVQIPRNPSLKNLCVSNFDINAVGPTSW